MGAAMMLAKSVRRRKSPERSRMMRETDAPKTFRMPISLARCWVENDARPNNPRQAMRMARPEKLARILPVC